MSISSHCNNKQCNVSISSSFISFLSSIILILFVSLFPRKKSENSGIESVGAFRRFAAFYIDFSIILTCLIPLIALPQLLIESSIVGTFHWSVNRSFVRESDSIYMIPAFLFSLVLIFYYFYKYPKLGNQTVGQYVLGYKIVALKGSMVEPSYGLRVVYSYMGLCIWPISVYYSLQSSNRTFWWDNITNTKAVCVQYESNNKKIFSN